MGMDSVAQGWEEQVEYQQSATSQFFCFQYDIFLGASSSSSSTEKQEQQDGHSSKNTTNNNNHPSDVVIADQKLRRDLIRHGALSLFTSIAAAASSEFGFEWERSIFAANNNNNSTPNNHDSSSSTPLTKIPRLQMLIRVPDAVEEQLKLEKEAKDLGTIITNNKKHENDIPMTISPQRRSTSPFARLHDDVVVNRNQKGVINKNQNNNN